MTALHALNGHASPSPHASPAGQNTVKTRLTSRRGRRLVENDDYAAFTRRILRAYARRVASGDVEALALMLGLSADLDTAIAQAVTGLRKFGYSWAEIGSRLGITRQAAQQRWGQAS
jgi:biotin operon repressor